MNQVTMQASSFFKKRTVRKTKVSWVGSHFRRLSVEFINLFVNHAFVLWLMGLINKRFRFIESIFLVYPANLEYALAYVYPWRLKRVMWCPWPCGLLWQNGKVTIMLCISATNEQFLDHANLHQLRQVVHCMERLRVLLGASRKTFAGVLPGILYCNRISREAPEADLTAKLICQAVNRVKKVENLPYDIPVVVLGGRGVHWAACVEVAGGPNLLRRQRQ